MNTIRPNGSDDKPVPKPVARLIQILNGLSAENQAEFWPSVVLNLAERLNEETNRGAFSTDCADSEDPRGRLRK